MRSSALVVTTFDKSLHLELKKSHALFYKPYPYFVQDGDVSDSPGAFQLEGIEALFRGHRYNDVRQLSANFIKHTLAGLRYLETYVICG